MTLTNLRLAAQQKNAVRREARRGQIKLTWAQIVTGINITDEAAPEEPISTVELPPMKAPQLAITWPYELPNPRADLRLNGHLCSPTTLRSVYTIALPHDEKLISILPPPRQPLLAICAPPAPPVLKGGADFAVLMGSRYFDQFRHTPAVDDAASTTSIGTGFCRRYGFSTASTTSVATDGYVADSESSLGSVQIDSQARFYEYDVATDDSQLSVHSSAGHTPNPRVTSSETSVSTTSVLEADFYPDGSDRCDCPTCSRAIQTMAGCPVRLMELLAQGEEESDDILATAAISSSSLLLNLYAEDVDGCECIVCLDAMRMMAACPVAQDRLLLKSTSSQASTVAQTYSDASELHTSYSNSGSPSSAYIMIPQPASSDISVEPVAAEVKPSDEKPAPVRKSRAEIEHSLDYWKNCQLICAMRVRSATAALDKLSSDC
ncbi:unnamed protein product, partial [Mesorhabditis spiculigera]